MTLNNDFTSWAIRKCHLVISELKGIRVLEIALQTADFERNDVPNIWETVLYIAGIPQARQPVSVMLLNFCNSRIPHADPVTAVSARDVIARARIEEIETAFDSLRPHLDQMVHSRGVELLESHQRVRQASRVKGVTYEVRPNLPVDVLAIYQYLPSA